MRELIRLPWRALRALLLSLAVAVLAFEEWGWRPLVAAGARIAQWPPLARLEQRLRGLPPGWAAACLFGPAVLLFPVKLLALWLIHLGHAVAGIAVIVVAKLLGTALFGRLFVVTEPQLMRLAWFARALGWWRQVKCRVHAATAAWPAWQLMRRSWAAWRLAVQRWLHALG